MFADASLCVWRVELALAIKPNSKWSCLADACIISVVFLINYASALWVHLIFICWCDGAQDWNLICVCVMEGNVHWTGLFRIDKYGVIVLHQSRYFISNCCCDTNMVKFLHLCLLCMKKNRFSYLRHGLTHFQFSLFHLLYSVLCFMAFVSFLVVICCSPSQIDSVS